MTTLEAIALVKSRMPEELSAGQVAAIREVLEKNPAVYTTLGGREEVEQWLAAAEKAIGISPVPQEVAPSAVQEPPASWRGYLAAVLALVVLIGAAGTWLYSRWPSPRNDDVGHRQAGEDDTTPQRTDDADGPADLQPDKHESSTEKTTEPSVGSSDKDVADDAAKQRPLPTKLASTEEPVAPATLDPPQRPEPPTEPPTKPATEEEWLGWTVVTEEGAKVARKDHWDFSEPGNPRRMQRLATQGGTVTLSAKHEVASDAGWLRLEIRDTSEEESSHVPARLEVLVDGKPIARGDVSRGLNADPLLVGIEEFQGRRVRLAVAVTPGNATQQVEWRMLEFVKRKASSTDWRPATVISASSQAGVGLVLQPDQSILADGETTRVHRGTDTYVLHAASTLPRITAIRLEALPDPRLPAGGPGHDNGGFDLTAFRVHTMPWTRTPLRGRYVRVELTGDRRILSLADVEVFRPSPDEKILLAHLKAVEKLGEAKIERLIEILDTPVEMRSVEEKARLRIAQETMAENLALAGKAQQSSSHPVYTASYANNGNVGDFSHTESQVNPWWEVDLGAEQPIERIVVWNRIDFGMLDRLAGFTVSVLSQNREVRWKRDQVSELPLPALELSDSDGRPLGFRTAVATHCDDPSSDGHTLDAASGRWVVSSRPHESQAAVYTLVEPFDPQDEVLVIRLVHRFERTRRTLGRFRILFTGDPQPDIPAPAVTPLLGVELPLLAE